MVLDGESKTQRARLRAREKLEQRGLGGLTDAELISVILGSGVDGSSVAEMARRVTRLISGQVKASSGGVGAVESGGSNSHSDCSHLGLDWRRFLDIRGMGLVKSMQVVCALELGRRLYGRAGKELELIEDRQDVLRLFHYLRKYKQEHVIVAAVNARNEYLGKKTIAVGSSNKAVVEMRDVFSWAIGVNATGIILVHNHPSGDTEPSESDLVFTERLAEGGKILGIELMDHVVM